MLIDAEDENGKLGSSKTARTRLVINIEDVNDVPPLFKQRKYEGFMSSDLSHLRNNLQVNLNFHEGLKKIYFDDCFCRWRQLILTRLGLRTVMSDMKS